MATYNLTVSDLDRLIRDVRGRERWLRERTAVLVQRLAELGAENARISFAAAPYDGVKDCTVTAEPRGENVWAVKADGETVLFIEFGAGITYANPQHPEAGINGMGVGTYPGQTHAFDPNGWYIPKSAGGGHTYGNPASMPMYNAVKYLEQNLQQIVQEVFR